MITKWGLEGQCRDLISSIWLEQALWETARGTDGTRLCRVASCPVGAKESRTGAEAMEVAAGSRDI